MENLKGRDNSEYVAEKWEDNIKMGLREIEFCVWSILVYDRDLCGWLL
jgi:hypothetical protein